MRQKSKGEILPHVDHLSHLLMQRQRSVEQYCGKQQVDGFVSDLTDASTRTFFFVGSRIAFEYIYVS